VLLTAAAYVLLQELRLRAAGTDCARAQVWTLRERLLKLGARVLVSVRRVVVHLPASFRFFPPSGQWRWHWERRPDNTGLALPQNFLPPYRNYRTRKNPVRKPLPRQLLHAHQSASTIRQPKSSHAIMFGVIWSPHKPLSAPSRIKRAKLDDSSLPVCVPDLFQNTSGLIKATGLIKWG